MEWCLSTGDRSSERGGEEQTITYQNAREAKEALTAYLIPHPAPDMFAGLVVEQKFTNFLALRTFFIRIVGRLRKLKIQGRKVDCTP